MVTDAAHRNVRGEAGSHWYPEKCVAHESVLIKHVFFKDCASVGLDAFRRVKYSKQPIANNIHEDWEAV